MALAILAALLTVGPDPARPAAAQADQGPLAVDPDTLSSYPTPGGGVEGFTQSSASSQTWKVHAFAQIDDRIFVGGSFTSVSARPWAGAATYDQPFIAAFDLANNDYISSWTPVLDDVVWALAAHDGKLFVGGEFDTVNGVARSGLVALDPISGEIVPDFVASIANVDSDSEATVRELEIDGDDLYVGGEFNRLIDAEDEHGVYRLARVNAANGDFDKDFLPQASGGGVYSVSVDRPNDRVLIAGTFTSMNAWPSTRSAAVVARTDGSALDGFPITLNGNWHKSYVTVIDGDNYWIAGEQHLTQSRDANDWSLNGCMVTGAVGPTDDSICSLTWNDTTRTGEGGDYQVAEQVADNVIVMGCHCGGAYVNTMEPAADIVGRFGSPSGAFMLHRSDGSLHDWRANMRTWGEGPYAAFADTNGCLYVGGDYGGATHGFGRFCPIQDLDADGQDDLDDDADGIIDWLDEVDTARAVSLSPAGSASGSSVLNSNVALFGSAHANDGNPGGRYKSDLVSITASELEPWWELDLGAPVSIAGINIYNRYEAPERLDGVEVLVGDEPFGDVDLATARAAATYSVVVPETELYAQLSLPDVVGRYVRLQLPTTNYLQLGEVDVFETVDSDADGIGDHRDSVTSEGSLVSSGKAASQSSLWGPEFAAANAVDGDLGGNYPANAISHTQSETEAWWEVDLGGLFAIDGVNVHNRTDCCQERLADVDLLIADEPFGAMTLAEARAHATWSTTVAGAAGDLEQLAVPGIAGRYVRLQLAGANILNLGEVSVLGTATDLPPFGTPANVELATNGTDTVTITWEPVANAKGYLVHRDYQFIGYLADGTELVDTDVVEGETYRYQVRAQAMDNTYSGPSPLASITVFDDNSLPPFGTPANVA
ncbi:MAG: discoidin domain-containing protein, partial [Actinomycetota bacterium]